MSLGKKIVIAAVLIGGLTAGSAIPAGSAGASPLSSVTHAVPLTYYHG